MPSLGTVTLSGKSGVMYKFRAYPVGTVFKKGFAAVYLLTQRTPRQTTGAVRHKPLFLGQSADLRIDDSAATNASQRAAANCICVHAEQNGDTRTGIEQDLVEKCRPRKG